MMFRHALQEISTPIRMHDGDLTNFYIMQTSYRTPSPAEEVIQQRSRTWFYDVDNEELDNIRTPLKEGLGRLSQLSRKRLLLTPPDSNSKTKRQRLSGSNKQGLGVRFNLGTPLKTELGAYSTEQLVDIIDRLVTSHPELEHEVRETLPKADLTKVTQELQYLRCNVYRALPSSRWESSRDAFTFKCVKLHLEAFKKACVDHGRRFLLATCWDVAVDYVLEASRLTSKLPDWDNPSHNELKKFCMRTLAAQCMVALRRGFFAASTLKDIRMRLESALNMNPELLPCISQVDKLLQ